MTDLSHGHEHELEPQFGLPEPLPKQEKILWQGSPDWKSMAVHVFHVRKLVVYFALLLLARALTELSFGGSLAEALISALWLLPLAVFAVLIMGYVAYLSAQTTVYTITDQRLVMRVGIVLTLTFNLPYSRLASASLKCYADGSGDIPVALEGHDKIAYVHLWPHAKPWAFARPEPALRCVPNAEAVAGRLREAWAARRGETARVAAVQAENLSAAGADAIVQQDMRPV